MSVTIYHNPRCSKSRKTLALLEEKGVETTVIEYLNETPNVAELSKILKMMGKTPTDILRAKDAKEAGIDVDGLSDDDLLVQMVTHPISIERPIVVNGNQAALGRPPEDVLAIL